MKPTLRPILVTLIIFIFGIVPVVHGQTAATGFTATVTGKAICADPPQSYSGEIELGKVDYWEIWLVAGQQMIIDVDAEAIDSTLDAYLEIFDENENVIALSNDQRDIQGHIISLDPYLEVSAPSNGYYYIAISSASTPDTMDDSSDDSRIGPYKFTVQCSDGSSSSELKWPVQGGDLLAAAGSNSDSFISINPESAKSSLPFPLGIGPIRDVEFDPSSELFFVAVDAVGSTDTGDYTPGRIVAISPDSGKVVQSYSLETESIVSLEAAEDKLYVVRVDPYGVNFTLALVTFDTDSGTAKLTDIVSFKQDVWGLAYNQSEKLMYGASGAYLIKFDPTSSPVEIQEVGSPNLGEILALDFDLNDTLYVVDNSFNLFKIPDLTLTEQPIKIGAIDASSEVSGLTFVVGDVQDIDPIKTICSSTLSNTTSTSSETEVHKFARLRLKKNPLHRAIGLYKFQGIQGESITLRVEQEGEEAVVAEDKSSLKRLLKSWLAWEGKGRVFVGIRDAIPDVDFRARGKGQIPFDMTTVPLPKDGYYYVMVIRPLLKFYKTDYCLTLKSDREDSQAWRTLDVVWPDDDSEEGSATTSAEAMTVEPQSNEVLDEASPGSEDTTFGEIPGELSTPTGSDSAGIAAPDASMPEPVDEGSGQELQPTEKTTVSETSEVAPVEEPAVAVTEEPAMMGAPAIPEETTVSETSEIPPEKSADVISGDNEPIDDGSSNTQVTDDYSNGAESPEGGDTTNVVEEDPPEASKS